MDFATHLRFLAESLRGVAMDCHQHQKRLEADLRVRAMTMRAIAGVASVSFILAACQSTPSAPTGVSMTSGAVTASDARLDTRSGFLTDYARLAPVPGGDGIKCWRQP